LNLEQLQQIQNECKISPVDEEKRKKYIDMIGELFFTKEDFKANTKSKRILSREVLSLILNGIEIDNAVDCYEYLEGLKKEKFEQEWKIIKECNEIKENKNNHGLMFLSGLLYSALVSQGEIKHYLGNIIGMMMELVGGKNVSVSEEAYQTIVKEYFVSEISKKTQFPDWELVHANPYHIESFCIKTMKCISNREELPALSKWLETGKEFADKKIEILKIEEKIPKSRIHDLESILGHYSSVEKQLRSLVYENDEKEKEIEKKNKEIKELYQVNVELKGEIASQNVEIINCKEKMFELQKNVEELMGRINGDESRKKRDDEAMLKEVARKLSPIYRDFRETEGEPVDVELGEMYRKIIQKIFKILSNNQIEVN